MGNVKGTWPTASFKVSVMGEIHVTCSALIYVVKDKWSESLIMDKWLSNDI